MKSLICNLFVFLLLASWGHSQRSHAQMLTSQQLLPSTINEDQDFGYSVDIYGDVAVVGAFRDEDGILLETGAAFVYRFDGSQWVEEQKLESSDRNILNWFGWDAALSENTLLVSARNGDTFANNGGDVAVYRYASGIWQEETILTPSDQIISDYGFEVAIDGAVAAVGAPGYPSSLGTGGAVYVYRHDGTTWVEEDLLIGSNLSNQSLFGSAIAIDGDRMLVGAFNADDSTSNQAGKLYVYEYDGAQWNETAELQSDESNNIANLGISVGLEDEWAIAGAQLDDELASGSGAVYVYRHDGQDWGLHSKLTASDGAGFFLFGIGATIADQKILVGAENWFEQGGDATGKAYLFEYDESTDQWFEADSFVPAELNRGSQFGKSVAMHNGTMIIGAPEFSGQEDDMGTAFIYGKPSVSTSIEQDQTPNRFAVSPPYPNPFRERTSITFDLPQASGVTLTVYNSTGQLVSESVLGIQPAGINETTVEASGLPSGVYFYRLQMDGAEEMGKMIVMR